MYPLKFQPLFQRRLWGGTRLRSVLGKPVETGAGVPFGESWEIADLPGGTVKKDSQVPGVGADGAFSNRIANGALAGKTLHEAWNSTLRVQEAGVRAQDSFPLLIKFLDAAQDLSVQVHPDAAYCRNHPGSHLKSEAWYILHAEPGAKIYKGVKAGVTREQFRAALETGEVAGLLNAIPVRRGDCHYLVSGTVHALGAGILAAEVQTPSDTTFRVFDWNRLGPDGKPRALHVKEALECINFDEPRREPIAQGDSAGTRLVSGDYFTIDRVQFEPGQSREVPGQMAVWIILEGQGVISCEGGGPTAFARGDTLLLPATMKKGAVKTIAASAWLEAKIPAAGAA